MPTVLISGGSGCLGRALIRSCLRDPQWSRVASISRDEHKVASLYETFGAHEPFRAFLGDVRDRGRMQDACQGIDVVIMAAALKRVDVCSYNPDELFKTNVIGVDNTIRAAVACGVKKILLISSDKATSASNAYGLSKAMAENIACSANVWAYPRGSRIASVRYGNIVLSTGSVGHVWRKQAAAGQRLTLTDARMTRFMMRVEDATKLIDYAVEHMQGGEIFVPVLPTASMYDFATAIAPDAEIECVGLRPGGEKIAEALLNDEEPSRTRRVSSDYLAVIPSHHAWTKDDVWGGDPVTAEAQHYRSDNPGPLGNKKLSVGELRELLASTKAMA